MLNGKSFVEKTRCYVFRFLIFTSILSVNGNADTRAIIANVGKVSRRKSLSIKEASGNQGKTGKAVVPLQESSSNGSLPKTTSIIAFAPILVIILVAFSVYFNALLADFVFDDNAQILDNPWIKDIRNIPAIFSKSVWSFQPGPNTSNYYRPLMHVVYMLNYHVFGLKPWGYHLVNVLFHCGVAVLVFVFMRRSLLAMRVRRSRDTFHRPL